MTLRNIDEIAISKAVLVGTERFAGRDGSGDFKATIQAIADLVVVETIPIGTIIPHDDTFPNTPALGATWADCDGAIISTGVYTGYRARNLNGANVVLSLTWTADGGGAYATVTAVNLTALNVGDTVTGAGFTNVNGQPSMIIDITGSLITINETTATGALTGTFTNEGVYVGGGSTGGSTFDTMQRHFHRFRINNLVTSGAQTGRGANTGGIFDDTGAVAHPTTDSINGPPRTSTRTKPHTRFLKYVMKIA